MPRIKEMGFTQTEIAEISGVSRVRLHNYCYGNSGFSSLKRDEINHICNLLKIDEDELKKMLHSDENKRMAKVKVSHYEVYKLEKMLQKEFGDKLPEIKRPLRRNKRVKRETAEVSPDTKRNIDELIKIRNAPYIRSDGSVWARVIG